MRGRDKRERGGRRMGRRGEEGSSKDLPLSVVCLSSSRGSII
jgi:hypothetical protein